MEKLDCFSNYNSLLITTRGNLEFSNPNGEQSGLTYAVTHRGGSRIPRRRGHQPLGGGGAPTYDFTKNFQKTA